MLFAPSRAHLRRLRLRFSSAESQTVVPLDFANALDLVFGSQATVRQSTMSSARTLALHSMSRYFRLAAINVEPTVFANVQRAVRAVQEDIRALEHALQHAHAAFASAAPTRLRPSSTRLGHAARPRRSRCRRLPIHRQAVLSRAHGLVPPTPRLFGPMSRLPRGSFSPGKSAPFGNPVHVADRRAESAHRPTRSPHCHVRSHPDGRRLGTLGK